MFSSKVRGSKAFAAEQNIREFKKLLFKSKKLHKASKTSRVDPRKLIRNAVKNINKTNWQKYGVPPAEIEEKSLTRDKFREIYDIHRMVRVSKDTDRYKRSNIRFDKRSRRKLRSPLAVGKKVLALAERLQKKTHQVTVCSDHVTYAFQSESTLYSCLNVKELLARSRREI